MSEKTEWQRYFDSHAPFYEDNNFTKGTSEEVRFLITALSLTSRQRILDVGCGTGRHAVALAKKNFLVTGIDISEKMLTIAKKNANTLGVNVNFIQADATSFSLKTLFDVAICVCEGAFGIMNPTDDPTIHDLSILKSIHAALKDDGHLFLTCPNGLAKIREYEADDFADGKFDPLTMTETFTMDVTEADGTKTTVKLREHGYTPPELKWLFKETGFDILHIGGGSAGNWSHRPIDPDEMELMVIAQKKH